MVTPELSPEVLAGLRGRVRIPDYDPESVRVGQVHLGLGGFHRAHQAVYADSVLARHPGCAISAYTWRNAELADALTAQDGLFTVVTADEDREARIIGSIRRARSAAAHPARFAAEVADPAVTVVTLTVTEKAYPQTSDGHLDTGNPAIARDRVREEPGESVIGLLTRALAERARRTTRPLAVISCDNLSGNGLVTERLVHEFAQQHPVYREAELSAWLAGHVTFPSTVVDRIVPGPAEALGAEVRGLSGVRDAAAVLTEPYRQWIIEDRFLGERPPWDEAGAVFVPEVAPYEQLKLRVLNAAHTALAYPGLLAGQDNVREAVTDPAIRAGVEDLIDQEIIPHLPVVEADPAAYAATVLRRFANPEVPYSLAKLGADGSQKIRQRLAPTAVAALERGHPPHRVAAVLASWIRWVVHCAREQPDRLMDPHSAALLEIARTHRDESVALRILDTIPVVPERLSADPVFREEVLAGLRTASR